MKVKVYRHIAMILLPAALMGCSGEKDSLPEAGKAGLEIENLFQPQCRYRYGPCSGKRLRHGAAR